MKIGQDLAWRGRVAAVVVLWLATPLWAEPVAVHYPEGTVHGFLVLRSLEGKTLAAGDLIQLIRGERVTSHLVFRFKDGSLDDETSEFSQQGHFRLLRDHHIQKGPAYTHPVDATIDAETGEVNVRYSEKGHEKVDRAHIELPADLANGMLLNVLKNVDPETKGTTVSYLSTTPKPRLVKFSITAQGEEPFSVAGAHLAARRFVVKVELEGFEGMFASLLGKGPPDFHVWVMGGEAPAFVKSVAPLYLGGPSWVIEMTSPVWPGGMAHVGPAME